MRLSTSENSSTTVPLLSIRRIESLGPMAQMTMSFSDGNTVPQAGSNSSLYPAPETSTLNVTWQVLSRAALEISQAPTIPWAVSLGEGVCAATIAGETAGATVTNQPCRIGTPRAIADARTLSRHMVNVMSARHRVASSAATGSQARE